MSEPRGRYIVCRGCPTVECTCFTDLERELLDKLTALLADAKELRDALNSCLETLDFLHEIQVMKDGVSNLISATRDAAEPALAKWDEKYK